MSRERDRRDREGARLHRPVTAPDTEAHDLVVRAIAQARSETAAAEFVPDLVVARTGTGSSVVHLRQHHLGIPVFEGSHLVRFGAGGRSTAGVDRSVPLVAGTPGVPRLTAQQAVLWAAGHVARPDADERTGTDQFGEPLHPAAVELAGFRPEIVAAFTDHADRPTVLAAGPFGAPTTASLVWFPLAEQLVLGWEIVLTMPGFQEQFRTVVDAHNGEVLYCRQVVRSVMARGEVHGVGNPPVRAMVSFPRPLSDYEVPAPTDLPAGFPDQWVAVDATEGNCARARPGDAGAPVPGAQAGGIVTFSVPEPSLDQDVITAFCHACTMHDVLYLLGFTESGGNFQHDSMGRGGIGNDPVDVRCFPGPVHLTASMATPVDGFGAVLNLGRVTATGRHTARDATVVYHEYTHGLTNRLVGGPTNSQALQQPQSAAMGEGWSDFVACILTGSEVVGAWSFGRAGGLRRARYDTHYPFDYRWVAVAGGQPHTPGEIWCAALMELARRTDHVQALHLVVDALPLTPANPSFLDGRDALLVALGDWFDAGRLSAAEHGAWTATLWQVFARFGMGTAAMSIGAGLTGIVADFSVPATVPDEPAVPFAGVVAPGR